MLHSYGEEEKETYGSRRRIVCDDALSDMAVRGRKTEDAIVVLQNT